MSSLLKVREIITLKGWVDGSGWSYSQCYSDKVIDITEGDLKEIDWDWYETDSDNPPTEDEDTKIIVDLYAADADIDEDKPLATHSAWISEIWKERHNISKDDFVEMVCDWKADNAPQSDHIEIDKLEIEIEDGKWVAYYYYNNELYCLTDDGNCNIVINYIGKR